MRAIVSWFALWLVGWLIAAPFLPRTPAIPVIALNNAIAAERLHVDGVAGRTVLLGSSLIGQLPVSRLDARGMNLGLSAYGAATGMLLVERRGQYPAVAVVETNELLAQPERGYADSLFDATRRRWAALRATRFEFRPSTQAIAAVVRVSQLLRRLQPEAGKRRAEQRAAEQFASERADTVGARANARWVAAHLRAWRDRGVRVVLLTMPQHEAVQEGATARADRVIVDAELPSAEFARLSLGDRAWRTTDGRHLERDDAQAAATLLRAALRAALARP